jgi:hypothetical protein
MAQIVITQCFVKGRGMMMSACVVVMGIVLALAIPAVATLAAGFVRLEDFKL